MDPYEVLGVGKDADEKTVKKAFKRAASESHPDKGKEDREKFQMVVWARDVLTDPARREHFDRTGKDRDVTQESEQLRKELATIMVNHLDSCSDDNVDLVSAVRKMLVQSKKNRAEILKKSQRKIAKYQKAINRIKSKSRNLAGEMMQGVLHKEIQECANHMHILTNHDKLLTMLSDYEYSHDTADSQVRSVVHFVVDSTFGT